MPPRCLSLCVVCLVFLSTAKIACSEDIVELTTGAKLKGKVVSRDDQQVVVEVVISGKTFARPYPISKVRSMTIDGQTIAMDHGNKAVTRSQREVLELIAKEGPTLPDWFEATKLSYPPTLDLDWPKPAPKGWDNSKNVGQFIWDRINPNPGQWRNGVKLMHHLMDKKREDRQVVQQAMLALGGMYHHLLVDYPRAAYWLQRSGVNDAPDEYPHATLQLADSYFHLGSKPMAMALIGRMKRRPHAVIKLLGDLGESEQALRMAEQFAKQSEPVVCFLYAGDVCRVAGNLDQATRYYERALAASSQDTRNKGHAERDRKRAEASLAAIRFYQIKPSELADGEYQASSIGYEDEVQVKVTVRQGRIENVEITQHREKQFYSSISDTPPRIVAKQGVRNVDAVTGATITSEAIINATAKALSQGRQ